MSQPPQYQPPQESIEWHQTQHTAPPGFFGPPTSPLNDVQVLVGHARDPDTHELMAYIAPLGTPPPTSYPPGGSWIPLPMTSTRASRYSHD